MMMRSFQYNVVWMRGSMICAAFITNSCHPMTISTSVSCCILKSPPFSRWKRWHWHSRPIRKKNLERFFIIYLRTDPLRSIWASRHHWIRWQHYTPGQLHCLYHWIWPWPRTLCRGRRQQGDQGIRFQHDGLCTHRSLSFACVGMQQQDQLSIVVALRQITISVVRLRRTYWYLG